MPAGAHLSQGGCETRRAGRAGRAPTPQIFVTRSRPARLAASSAESAARKRPRPSVSSTRLATPAETVSWHDPPVDEFRARGGDGPPDPFGGLDRAVAIGGRGDHDEFLAAVADHDVAVAGGAPDRPGDAAQDGVPDGVAVLVVDRREPVEVEHDQAQLAAGSPGVGVGGLDRLVEEAPVEQAGQRVAQRRIGDPGVQVGVLEGDRDLGGQQVGDAALELGDRCARRRRG